MCVRAEFGRRRGEWEEGLTPPPPVRIVFPLAGDGEGGRGGRGGLFDVSGLCFFAILRKSFVPPTFACVWTLLIDRKENKSVI